MDPKKKLMEKVVFTTTVIGLDIMHHPLQCAEPDWNSCFCVNPVEAREMRREFLAAHAGTPTLIMPAHFPTPSAGQIIEANNAYSFKFSDKW